LGIKRFIGEIEIEERVGGVTVNAAEPVIEAKAAWIVTLPIAAPVAKPAEATVARAGFDEDHVTESVRFWVLPSLYEPVAVSCSVLPLAIDELPGVTAIDTRARGAVILVRGAPPVEPAQPERDSAKRARDKIQ
jgi:hypothetical protein